MSSARPIHLILLLVFMALLWPLVSEGGSTSASDTRPRIVAFGDSLTAGLGVQADESYPAQLQRRLDSLGYHYRVINAGVSGDTTAGGLRRVPWILNNNPKLVILELGANDGLRGLPVEQTKNNLRQIIRQLQEAGTTVVLAGMKLPPNYGQDYTASFEAMYQMLAKECRLLLIPFFLEGVGGSSSLNQADGIHPTREGYEVIVEQILTVLRPLLNERVHKPTPGPSRVEDEIARSEPATSEDKAMQGGSTRRYSLRLLKKRVVDAVREDYCDQRIVQAGDSTVIRSPSAFWGVRQHR